MSPKPTIPEEDAAMQAALRLLGYRARSEAEMRQRLERKHFAPALVDRTLRELTRLGLLDDREFARAWVASRTGRGRTRLKQELLQKGIDRDLAESIVDTGLSAEEEFVAARDVALRAVRTAVTPLDHATLLRVRRLLQRRGFSFDVIGRVCAGLHAHLTAEGDWLE